MRAAIVDPQTGIVSNLIVANAAVDTCPTPNSILVNVTGFAAIGWVWDGQNFINPNPPVVVVPTFEELKQKKLNQLAALRWEKETAGTTFNSMSFATDPISQTKYVGAVVAAQMSPLLTLKWKLSDGTFVDLDAASITQVAMAVRAHIQACFDREAELIDLIELAVDEEDLNNIDITTGWPS